ncbi:hypothetical protein LIER_22767 [Lithospermum erythrorhizon]|uniref:ATP-dependent DNA helicase n=1 Tax=Lithospermum erythrorhizon TaxID=34254 RepID=A0AAV3QWA6_LITER
MTEDFVRIKNQMHLFENDVLQKVLQGINDTLESLGRDIIEFKLVSFQYVPNEYESAAMPDSSGVFFVDGPGETGKSFLYTILLAHIRSKRYVALIVASSGISSSNFLGGRTTHSRFKVPIDIEPNNQIFSVSNFISDQ